MFLKNIEIGCFRSLDKNKREFDSQVTFFGTEDCVGFTTGLDAVAVLLQPVIDILMGEPNPDCPLSYWDTRHLFAHRDADKDNYEYCHIDLRGEFVHDGEVYVHSCHRVRQSEPAVFGNPSPLLEWARELNASVSVPPVDYPLLVYYGADRDWEHYYTPFDGWATQRSDGYIDALKPHLDYKPNIDWIMLYDRPCPDGKPTFQMQLLNKAISGVFTAFSDIIFDTKRNMVCCVPHDTGTNMIPLAWMNSCTREAFMVVIDIVRRIVTLNPHLGLDALEMTTGIVMLDDLRMFMVPSFQTRIANGLRTVFPKIEFLVTVHDMASDVPLVE